MTVHRPLAAVMAAAVAASALAVAGSAAAAPTRTFNLAPTTVLAGLSGGVDTITTGMTVDDAGRVYVAGYDSGMTNPRIEVYAAGAAGTAAPLRTIAGPQTDLVDPFRMVVDDDGFLYVSDANDEQVHVFAPNAAGDVMPARTIEMVDEYFVRPGGIDIGPDGNLYVGDYDLPEVHVLPRTADSLEDALYSFGTESQFLDEIDALAVSPDGSEVYATEDAYGADQRIVVLPNPVANDEVEPTRTIEGPSTRMQYVGGVETDSTGNAYVVDYDMNEILVFGPTADGDVAPHTVLGGAATGIVGGWNLAVHPDRRITVASWDDNTVRTFAALTPYVAPSAVTGVTVSAPDAQRARTVSWKSTATADMQKVRYDVVVKRGATTVLSRKVDGTSLTLAKEQLRAGAHTVSVTAVNAIGSEGPVSAAFSVKAMKASKVVKLKVKGKARAAKRTVRWKTPAWDGGASITKYRVNVKQGKTAYVKKKLKPGKRKLVLDTRLFALGKFTATVQAKNSAGWGAKATKKFTVKP